MQGGSLLSSVGELIDTMLNGVRGWQYIFSRSFRARTHQKWRANRVQMVGDILLWTIGIGLTLLLMSVPFLL